MMKAKKYDWKDSNLALFGSDTEKQVKKESAESEPAWQGAGAEPGLQIWRIVKFKVTHWPKEDYGKFYSGDSYIVLNTFKEGSSETLCYDVHFWIGKESSQDEYGTAAYKTVELDTFLGDVPVQHREVQGHESQLFKSYFKTITLMRGGADSGFRHVVPEAYKPRLLHFSKASRTVTVSEVPLSKKRITDSDVFILDLGRTVYQYNGANCSKDEKFKAAQYCQQLESERNGKAKCEVLEGNEISPSHPFFASLQDDDEADSDDEGTDGVKELYKVSDAGGSCSFNKVKDGPISQGDFSSDDVFVLDTKEDLFVWIGKGASIDERKNALSYAHGYLSKTNHPFIPITCFSENKSVANFQAALTA
ncbi:hypothetical protein LOTGIDRAFT_192582 [Lottia gigantea]|uniref:Actin-modulator n=1 Tax=Lottia gigantea TaxID=225164 RepID=V3ZFQ9_LOTGI|nr:hypothetical protein LOTGIDRAFT_192582 [Lottia gigantea]ESO90008.1 hypothetical protein LOTGIDRAFT_192582 [Lottia gigantea]